MTNQQKIAVVTGAGSGLGRALALELVQRNVKVIGFGRRQDTLQGTAQKGGEGFVPMVVDVSDYNAVNAAFDQIEISQGPVDILINNAAVYPQLDILEETAQSLMQTVNINLGGTIACSRAALTGMVKRGHGRIIDVASFADIAPIPTSAAYSISKGAQRIFSRALHADLADRFPNIVLSTWLPGMLATDMGLGNGLDPKTAAKWGASLALLTDRSLNGVVFERDTEMLPHLSFKRRMVNRLLGKRAKPRRLTP
ncbi:YdfG [Rhodobacteraceae bacterium HTCC2150]|nr:YdfG [Rhodobacteraceae bacterium HTCC2150]